MGLIVVASYCHHVPKMDPSHALNSKLEPNAWDVTNQVLDSMKKRFRIANIYSIDLATVAAYYTEKRRAWRNAGGSPQSTASDNDGGLNEYSAKFETAHKQFGSLRHDKKDLTHPSDKPYSRLSRLEQEEESEDPATPHSPELSFKTEGEEPRRSTSTATSINSTFTPVNLNNATTPVQREQMSGNVEAPNGTRPLYGPPTPQRPQQPQSSQPYPNQLLQYGQPSAYGYPSSTPAYPQPTSQYALQTTYAQTSGPNQGSGSSSHDPQALMSLEREGNRSLSTHDLSFFENDSYQFGQQSFLGTGYPFEQIQPQPQYMQDPQGPYMYPNQWPGQG